MTELAYAPDVWKRWSSLSESERKLRTAKAIQTEDHDELWLMTLAFLQFKGKKGTSISQHTLRAYRRGVFDYLLYLGGADILRVSPDEAQTYIRLLEQGSEEQQPKSPATVQLRTVAARRFYQALQWCGFEFDNPFDGVMIRPDPVRPEEKRSEYRLETVRDLIHACDTFDDPISRVAIHLAVLSGLRIEEIVNLRWRDIDFRELLIHVRGKGRKDRIVPLEVETAKAMNDLPHKGDVVLMRYYHGAWSGYQTAGLRARIKRLCLKAFGINPFEGTPNGYKGVHSFRHTLGIYLQEEVGPLETQALYGHERLSTTMVYSKVTSRIASERARSAQTALRKRLG